MDVPFFVQAQRNKDKEGTHNLSVNHAMCANPAVFNQFFKQYEAELKHLNIQSPQQI